jgi:hypothetical protein
MPTADVARAAGCGPSADCRSASRSNRKSDQDTSFTLCLGPCRDLPDMLPVDGLRAAAWVDGEGSVGNALQFAGDGIGFCKANPNLNSRGEGPDAAPTLWRLGHGGGNGYE